MTNEKNMETQILEAAEELFLEQGFTKTTTTQIAQKVGCNQALVHYYYRTKDRLFEQIFEKKAKKILRNFLETNNVKGTFKEKLTMKIETHFDSLKENRKLPVFLYNELSINPDRIKSMFQKAKKVPHNMSKRMDEELQKEIKKGTIKPITIEDLIFLMICLNTMPFLFLPIMQSVMELSNEQIDLLLEQKKKESVQTILARLGL